MAFLLGFIMGAFSTVRAQSCTGNLSASSTNGNPATVTFAFQAGSEGLHDLYTVVIYLTGANVCDANLDIDPASDWDGSVSVDGSTNTVTVQLQYVGDDCPQYGTIGSCGILHNGEGVGITILIDF